MAVIVIGVTEDGRESSASVNDTIVLRLPENPTTGVRWDFDQLEGPVRLIGDEYEPSTGAGIGAAAIRVLTLQPQDTGRIRIKLKRWQNWEGESTIDATFSWAARIE